VQYAKGVSGKATLHWVRVSNSQARKKHLNMKIKKGDKVVVIAGKDKGKTGEVTVALPKKAQVVIDGVHVVTKHQKSKQVRSQGQIINKSMPIHVSNVALIGEKSKAVRVGYTVEKEGKKTTKVRVARPSGKKI
jgi:large subunit ribosomal protein L24